MVKDSSNEQFYFSKATHFWQEKTSEKLEMIRKMIIYNCKNQFQTHHLRFLPTCNCSTSTSNTVWTIPKQSVLDLHKSQFNQKGYEKLKEHIKNLTKATMTVEEFHTLASSPPFNSVDEKQSAQWLHHLQLYTDHLLFFEKASDEVLQKILILNPKKADARARILSALDINNINLSKEIEKIKEELPLQRRKLLEFERAKEMLDTQAKQDAGRSAKILFALMIAQFPVIGYGVWGLYSWDVMEPFCYFYMLTCSGVGYLHFVRYKDFLLPAQRGMKKKELWSSRTSAKSVPSEVSSGSWEFVFRAIEESRKRKLYEDENSPFKETEYIQCRARIQQLERRLKLNKRKAGA
eukprot:g3241.t1